jgi:DNA/RNA endonuclease YhcR with UshA esterase domain
MKTIFLIVLFFVTASYGYSQTVINSQDAQDHIGETIMVKGKVADVYTSPKGKTLLNFDNKYPNQTFTAVINEDSKIDISTITAGVTLTVNGLIKSFKDKPEIIIETQDQIIKVE